MQDQAEGGPFAGSKAAHVLGRLVAERLEDGETPLAWSRAWVSRDGRLNAVAAARTRDFVVLTDHRLMLWSTGFFSRLPRHRVMVNRLVSIRVERIERRRDMSIRVIALYRSPLRFDLADDEQSRHLVDELCARVKGSDWSTPANAPKSEEDEPA